MWWHRIPKHAYFYWGDLNTLPWVRFLTLETFRYHNPDWKMSLYTSKYSTKYKKEFSKLNVEVGTTNVEEIANYDLSMFSNHIQDVCRSDFLRWYLLYEYGGLWSDMDIIYINSMNNITIANSSNNTAILPSPYNNFLLTADHADCFKDLWRVARECKIEDIAKDPFATGPVTYEKVTKNHKYSNLELLPLSTTEIADSDGKDFALDIDMNLNSNTIGVHWHGSGSFGKYIVVTKKNCTYHPSMFARLVAYALYLMK